MNANNIYYLYIHYNNVTHNYLAKWNLSAGTELGEQNGPRQRLTAR
jgi:hypothetical protein